MSLLLVVITLLIMAGVAYAYLREDILTSGTMCINVILAGMVAFGFYENLAGPLDSSLADTFLFGYADAACLTFLFAITLGLLRIICNNLSRTELLLTAAISRGGSVVFGLITGYLTSGFLICVLQTLPWYENFMGFKSTYPEAPRVNDVLSADQVWLALMYHVAGPNHFGYEEGRDKIATFQLRYAYYRRFTAEVDAQPHRNEKPDEIRDKLTERRTRPQEFLRKIKAKAAAKER